jgi:hypothetical protein
VRHVTYRCPHRRSVGDVPRGSSLGRGASRTGARCGRQLASQPLPLGSGERASARCTTRRNASSSCSMRPYPHHRVGARFSRVGLAEVGESRCSAQKAAVWHSDPNRAVPVRTTTDARDRSRSSEAPPAAARGVGMGATSSTAVSVLCNTLRGTMPRCTRSVEADAPYRVSPDARLRGANPQDSFSHPPNRGIASSRHRVNHGTDVAR